MIGYLQTKYIHAYSGNMEYNASTKIAIHSEQKKMSAREESPIHALIVVSCSMLSKIIECTTIWKHFFLFINIPISFPCQTKYVCAQSSQSPTSHILQNFCRNQNRRE